MTERPSDDNVRNDCQDVTESELPGEPRGVMKWCAKGMAFWGIPRAQSSPELGVKVQYLVLNLTSFTLLPSKHVILQNQATCQRFITASR